MYVLYLLCGLSDLLHPISTSGETTIVSQLLSDHRVLQIHSLVHCIQVAGGMLSSPSQLIPAEIKRELDLDVIGQERAKKILSVALHSHMIRIQKAEQVAADQAKRAPPDPDPDPGLMSPAAALVYSSDEYVYLHLFHFSHQRFLQSCEAHACARTSSPTVE